MTEEHIKEAISIRFIELIAAYNGYSTSSSRLDYGTDLDVKEIYVRDENDRQRYFETGRELKFQIKATTENRISTQEDSISYDLRAATYNDLIIRRSSRMPLLLILFILPAEPNAWIVLSDQELVCKKCAYWYFPEKTETPTTNAHSQRITISKSNLVSLETLNQLFVDFS